MRCEDEESNLCRRVLRQLLDQNRERLTECQEWQDGVWGDWEGGQGLDYLDYTEGGGGGDG